MSLKHLSIDRMLRNGADGEVRASGSEDPEFERTSRFFLHRSLGHSNVTCPMASYC